MLNEYFKIAIRSLKTRPLRSWLTILGIVIGVFLVISLVSLSQGIKNAVLTQMRMMGKDLVMVFPGEVSDLMTTMLGGTKLTEEDINAIKKTEGVKEIVPMTWASEVVRYQEDKKSVLLYGLPWEESLEVFKKDMGWSLTKGRWPVPGKRELVVGSLVPEDIFPGMEINTQAVIKGRPFKITGILKSLGSRQDDSMIGLDLEIFRDITGEREGAQFVMAKINSSYTVDEVSESIKDNLKETRKRKRDEDLPSFSVLSSEKAGGIVSSIITIMQALVFGMASIAIVVGGIGIMNTMYTTVHERTREIGIMKAVGAKSSTITTIFLIESGIVGLIGGLGGTVLGLGLAKSVELFLQVHPVFYLEASITPGLIFFGLGFSFLVGTISGFLPARRASKLNPVDALRYE